MAKMNLEKACEKIMANINVAASTGANDKKAYNKLMKQKSMSYEELKKDGNRLHGEKKARETLLVDSYKNKKLKSKALIKEARTIINKRKKEEEKQKKDG